MVSSTLLHSTYVGYCKGQGLRVTNPIIFGKACTEMFGLRHRLTAAEKKSTKWAGDTQARGYSIPTIEIWQETIDARLGIERSSP